MKSASLPTEEPISLPRKQIVDNSLRQNKPSKSFRIPDLALDLSGGEELDIDSSDDEAEDVGENDIETEENTTTLPDYDPFKSVVPHKFKQKVITKLLGSHSLR